jgi:hypothetical protein
MTDETRDDIEYRYIEGSDPADFSNQVQTLLRQGFYFRTDPYTDENGKVYAELIKQRRLPGYVPALPSGDFFSALGIGPEGKELLTRLGKAYNNPEFRKILEETVSDFVSKDENTAMTDEELRRLADME